MSEHYRLSPANVANLTLYMLTDFANDRGKSISRARVSKATLRKLSFRSRLRPEFIEEWSEELSDRGWAAVPIADEHFALIKLDSMSNWPRVGSKRIKPKLKEIRQGNHNFLETIADLFAPADDQDDDTD